tara:strand:- start:349 stop:810 length:462 start_codon:yes stop_codon:yes gene_type:complete
MSRFKHFINLFLFISLFILLACQFQEPNKNHGIVFLKNRSDQLVVNKTNKNDVLNIIGHPHSKSFDNENEWIYIERTISKGEYHKLGRHILKNNNVLVLSFDKYGILKDKIFLDKNDKNKVAFSNKKTENELAKKSFIQKFLQSVQSKMYGNR